VLPRKINQLLLLDLFFFKKKMKKKANRLSKKRIFFLLKIINDTICKKWEMLTYPRGQDKKHG